MFRINTLLRITSVATKTFGRAPIETAARILGTPQTQFSFQLQQRLYSKDDKKDKSKEAQKQKKVDACAKQEQGKKDPKFVLKECKPTTIAPCAPPPPITKSKIPYLDECAKPDLTSECTQPQCPYEEEEDKKSPYKNAVIIGLILAAATLAGVKTGDP